MTFIKYMQNFIRHISCMYNCICRRNYRA